MKLVLKTAAPLDAMVWFNDGHVLLSIMSFVSLTSVASHVYPGMSISVYVGGVCELAWAE